MLYPCVGSERYIESSSFFFFSVSGLHAGVVVRRARVGEVGGVLADGVVVGVVDDPQLAHHLAPYRGLNCPVVDVAVLPLPLQPLDVQDLGAEPVEDDADVLDGEVALLVDRQLVDQEQELAGGRPLLTLQIH
jgi:hypothetical protein